jgi:glycine betaine/proline transport system substrate-binding protein
MPAIMPTLAQNDIVGEDALEAVEPEIDPCGSEEITIADMRWPSASILANIHLALLTDEVGCPARIVSGDIASTGSSMATTQQPAVAPEMWVARIPEIWNSAISAGNVRPMASTYSGGPLEGWFVPASLAAANPGLEDASGLQDWEGLMRALVPAPEPGLDAEGNPLPAEPVPASDLPAPKFLTCPADWACAVINENLLRAFGLASRFEVITPANRFEMDQRIADAISLKEPLVFYYWQPNSALAQFGFHRLSLGSYEPDAFPCLGQPNCPNPQRSAFPSEPVVLAVADWVFADAPAVADYLRGATMPLEVMNALLAWQSERNADPAQVARFFIEGWPEVWQGWLPDRPDEVE